MLVAKSSVDNIDFNFNRPDEVANGFPIWYRMTVNGRLLIYTVCPECGQVGRVRKEGEKIRIIHGPSYAPRKHTITYDMPHYEALDEIAKKRELELNKRYFILVIKFTGSMRSIGPMRLGNDLYREVERRILRRGLKHYTSTINVFERGFEITVNFYHDRKLGRCGTVEEELLKNASKQLGLFAGKSLTKLRNFLVKIFDEIYGEEGMDDRMKYLCTYDVEVSDTALTARFDLGAGMRVMRSVKEYIDLTKEGKLGKEVMTFLY